MERNQLEFFSELIFALTIFPTMINAIIKSINLIHIPIRTEGFKLVIMQTNGGLIIYLIMIINMIFAIVSLLMILISLGLIYQKNPKAKNIESYTNFFIRLVSLSNILVVWFILNLGEEQEPNINYIIHWWAVVLFISLGFYVYESLFKLRKI